MYKKQASVTLLPVLPLRDVVVYPNMVIPLFVGRERSMKALELAMEGPDKQIVLLAQRSPDIDDPQAEDLYDIGTVATVIQLLKLPDGTIKVLVEGLLSLMIIIFYLPQVILEIDLWHRILIMTLEKFLK